MDLTKTKMQKDQTSATRVLGLFAFWYLD